MKPLLRAAVCGFLVVSSASLAHSADRAIVVLDASGSMWGQIDGKPKLEIARQTLRNVLQTIPADMELGLVAYGHRQKGSCEDIELVVPPAAGTANAITSAADQMKFLGKTPLSAAVKKAAEDLRYTEEKSTVILITDGLETCNADPCALGKELEQSGVDFTAHVVGFGLSAEEGKQVACLADNTGGKYIQASDAKGLEDALKVAVAPAPAPPPPPAPEPAKVEFNIDPSMVLAAGGPEVDVQSSGVIWRIYKKAADGARGELTTTEYDAWKGNLEAGDYLIEAKLGEAVVEQPVTVNAGQTVKPVFVLNAGQLTVVPFSAPGQKPDDVIIQFAYPGGETTEYGEKAVVLPAGETTVNVKVGVGEVSEKITLTAGQILKKDIVVGVGRVHVTGYYVPDQQADTGDIAVRIYKAAKKIDGSREDVTYGYGTLVKADVPPGDYVAVMELKAAKAEAPFTVKVGELTEAKVVLNAGVVAIDAPGAEGFRILEAKKDIQGERKGVTYDYGEKMQTTIGAGDYVVITDFKGDKADSETPFTVKAGERTELNVE